jgi:hypothetical protein
MVNVPVEYGAAQERPQNLGKKQIGHRAQLISRGGMPRHIDAQAAQLLYEPPDLGAAGRNFLRDFGAADHNRCVFHQQAHDAAEPDVRGLMGERHRLSCGFWRANCGGGGDAEIMREARAKDNAGTRRF